MSHSWHIIRQHTVTELTNPFQESLAADLLPQVTSGAGSFLRLCLLSGPDKTKTHACKKLQNVTVLMLLEEATWSLYLNNRNHNRNTFVSEIFLRYSCAIILYISSLFLKKFLCI